jgi:hypothetical protein
LLFQGAMSSGIAHDVLRGLQSILQESDLL